MRLGEHLNYWDKDMSIYYGQSEERIVAEFLNTNDESLFQEEVYPLLKKIAYGVCGGKRFKPVSYFRHPSIIDGCVSHLWECLRFKYNPNCGRTYSYLTTCAYHYFCRVSKTRSRGGRTLFLTSQEIEQQWLNMHCKSYVNQRDEVNRRNTEYFYYDKLIPLLEEKVETMKQEVPYTEAAKALITVMKNINKMNPMQLNKKALYSEVRRSSGAKTKQIKYAIDRHLLPLYLKVVEEDN